MSDVNAKQVAQWMVAELNRVKYLSQDVAVTQIRRLFGSDFYYTNDNGNWAIAKSVLREFRALTGDSVIWEKGERQWRKRLSSDQPGRQQD